MSTADLAVIAPLIAVVLLAAAIIVADIVAPGKAKPAIGLGLLGLGIVAALVIWTGATPGTAFGGSYRVDDLTTFLDLIFVAVVALTLLFGPEYLAARGLPVPEFAAILAFALAGAMLIAASADLLVLFLGLELMVIPGYLLAGYHKRDALSSAHSRARSSSSAWPSSGGSPAQPGSATSRPPLRRSSPDRRRCRRAWPWASPS
jgi:NADH-quinone oxidoreductase subunit N